jgi:hypothetical protein
MKNFDPYVEEAIGVRLADPDDAKFAGFLGEAIEDLNPGAQGQGEGNSKQGTTAADGDGFRGSVQGLAGGKTAENADWNANQDAAGPPTLNHRTG